MSIPSEFQNVAYTIYICTDVLLKSRKRKLQYLYCSNYYLTTRMREEQKCVYQEIYKNDFKEENFKPQYY